MQHFLDIVINFATTTGIKLLIALAVLIVGLKLIKLLVRHMEKGRSFSKIDSSVQSFFKSFISIGLKILLFVAILGVLGVETASFAALFASVGVAVGLALQGALGNFAGGLMILFFKPFKVGDYIDTHTDSGTVVDITVFYTILRTVDNRRITVPNGAMTNASIVNYSAEKLRRVDLAFAVDYGADVGQVKEALLEVAGAHPAVLLEPEEPFARLLEQADGAMRFALRMWCNADDYWAIYFDVTEEVKRQFAKRGISIPRSQLDVRMQSGGAGSNM